MLCDYAVFSEQLCMVQCHSALEASLNGSLFYTCRFFKFLVSSAGNFSSFFHVNSCHRITEHPLYFEHSNCLVMVLLHHSYCIPVLDTCETCLKPRYLFLYVRVCTHSRDSFKTLVSCSCFVESFYALLKLKTFFNFFFA